MDGYSSRAFRRALTEAVLEEYADVPAESDIEMIFSEEFEAFGIQLSKRVKRGIGNRVSLTTRRVLWAAVLLSLMVMTVMAGPIIREALIQYFVHDEGTHFEFSFDSEQMSSAPDTIETIYMPTYLPEGYECTSYMPGPGMVGAFWENKDGDTIGYAQQVMPDDPMNNTIGGYNAEGTSISMTQLNGFEIFRSEDTEVIYYIWTDNEYFFSLICDKSLSEDVMQKIFFSILPTQ